MYDGKENRLALIEELLTVANIENLQESKAEEILLKNHVEMVKNALVEAFIGENISKTLDQLSKEQLRMF
jgi:hypothetical protein